MGKSVRIVGVARCSWPGCTDRAHYMIVTVGTPGGIPVCDLHEVMYL